MGKSQERVGYARRCAVKHLNAILTRRPTSQGALAFATDITYCLLGDLQVTVFQQEHYLENFVQATFDALPENNLTGNLPLLSIP